MPTQNLHHTALGTHPHPTPDVPSAAALQPSEGSSILPGILAGHCGLILHSYPSLNPKLICQQILGASALKTHRFPYLAPLPPPFASQTWLLPGTCFIPLFLLLPTQHPLSPCEPTSLLPKSSSGPTQPSDHLHPALSDLSSGYSLLNLLHCSPQATSLPCQT